MVGDSSRGRKERVLVERFRCSTNRRDGCVFVIQRAFPAVKVWSSAVRVMPWKRLEPVKEKGKNTGYQNVVKDKG